MRRRTSSLHRWPLVVRTGEVAGRSRVRVPAIVAAILVVCAAPVVPGLPLALRFALAFVAAGALLYAAVRRDRARASGVSVVADKAGLTRISNDATKPIVSWDGPFGVTLLASYGRPHALLAFTTPTQTRYIPTRIDERSEDDDELFSRIAVLADLDFVDGVTHDAALTASDAAAIVRYAEEQADASPLGRVFLSDGRGVPIALDRATLSIDKRSFDLTSHLEWRALMFHESTGHSAALYQATWISQNGSEVVLVAPMPASIVPREPNAHREAHGRLGRALTRDLKLLQSPAEPPPSRDVRVAIDRPFMLAVRRVLDEAPLATRVVPPPPSTREVEKRDSII
ncbi:MAG: hypothetical protein KIT84_30585 [Labilithrix sp.]|nr:hypothetical protein [Labilithrix sp.]MCW5815414.1 hypothetical protein [Labilithrix sp.]